MRRWLGTILPTLALAAGLLAWPSARLTAQQTPALTADARDMALVGYDDL
jgi:hypothetical protein